MTLLPCEPIRITVPGVQDEEIWEGFPTLCQAPGCTERSVHTHEVVRRSYTGGAKRWVAVDGVVLLNQLRLCFHHHDLVTINKAWICYLAGFGWVWYGGVPAAAVGIRQRQGGTFIQHPKSGAWFQLIGPIKEARWNPATGETETSP